MTEEEDNWLHINRIPLAMSPPDPSHRATIVAAWLNSPAVMLTELTKTLNVLLSCCRYCADDPELLEVDTDKVDPSGILKCAIGGYFVSDIETLRIRNSIQPTPLNVEFVDDVRKHFDVCSQSTVQLQSFHEFTDAVRYYQYQLGILSDWIEASRAAAPTDQTAEPMGDDDAEFTEPIAKSIWCVLLKCSKGTLRNRLGNGTYRMKPGTLPTAKLVALHIDGLPKELKSRHNRKRAVDQAELSRERTARKT